MIRLTRRQFIKAAGVLLLAGAIPPRSSFAGPAEMRVLPIPDLSPANIIRFTACIRPHRRGRIRMEREVVQGKSIFHHYGHGGAGITLSWGSAEVVADQIERGTPREQEIAIAGAGIIGLSTAFVLAERGYRVVIYSRDFWPNTTSSTAGGQWCPTGVGTGPTDAEVAQFRQMLIRAYRRFESLAGSKYGVYPRVNYLEGDAQGSHRLIPPELISPVVDLERLPFPGVARSGRSFRSFLIEPPTYLPQLSRDLLDRGVRFQPSTVFRSVGDLIALPHETIVNCMGIGSKEVFDDPALEPYRGQLVHLKPQTDCDWLLVHQHGYIFPRHDAVVLGGTYEAGVGDPTPDPAMCMKIVEQNRQFFA